MSRVLLVVPVNPHLNRVPSLPVSYLAAALLGRGHEVVVIDLGAPHGPGVDDLVATVEAWRPHLIGLGLYTDTALQTYSFLERIPRGDALLVAGGVHATAVPREPVEQGFDVNVVGEGESAIVDLANLVDRSATPRAHLGDIPGIAYRDTAGAVQRTPPRPREWELDRLAAPYRAAHLFEREWYLPGGHGVIAGALVTSRGCGGKCSYCANLVTGRKYRAHTVERVLEEVQAYLAQEPRGAISFHDDAFTGDRERLLAILAELERLPYVPPWWCESRVDHMDAEQAARMAAAGCHSIVFGVESGDADTLQLIGKHVAPDQNRRALEAASAAGILTYCNIMLGFPGEDPQNLANTLAFMRRAAPTVGVFSPLGIPVPYPGTSLYARHAAEYGFRDWWLDADVIGTMYSRLPPGGFEGTATDQWWSVAAHLEESLLDIDFFAYTPALKDAIRACLAFRRAHNVARWGQPTASPQGALAE